MALSRYWCPTKTMSCFDVSAPRKSPGVSPPLPTLLPISTSLNLGLENHLNYIHRPGGTLTLDETWGLAALYSSRLLDTYFRAANGNTQISATEIRAMPLPTHETILRLGQAVRHQPVPLHSLDQLLSSLLDQSPTGVPADG